MMHFFGRAHRHPIHAVRNFQICRTTYQDDASASTICPLRPVVTHFSGRAIGEEAHRINILTSGASRNENRLASEIVTQPQHLANFLCDGLGGSETSRTDHSARQVAFVGIDDMNAAFAQNREVALRGGVVPHVDVHRRRNDNRSFGGEVKGREKIFRDTVCEFAENVSSSRRNEQQIDSLRYGNMFDGAFDVRRSRRATGAEHIGDYFLAGERREGERGDEFLRRAGHNHLHVQLFLLQAANQFRGFVSRNTSGNAECDLHLIRGCGYFFRLPSLSSGSPLNSLASYSSRPFSNSSSAMRVVLRDRGLSTMGRPPIINCRARRATTTT